MSFSHHLWNGLNRGTNMPMPIFPSGAIPLNMRIQEYHNGEWRTVLDNSEYDTPIQIERMVISHKRANYPAWAKVGIKKNGRISQIAYQDLDYLSKLEVYEFLLGELGIYTFSIEPFTLPERSILVAAGFAENSSGDLGFPFNIAGWAIHYR
jgi:hypothetical protein